MKDLPAPRNQRPSFVGVSPFDSIRNIDHDERGEFEWWSARDAMPLLGYERWENLRNVIAKAKSACRNSGHQVRDHFRDVTKYTAQPGRQQQDVQMSRFGMYLLAMNGDPDKPEIAAAQRYFAIQARRAEVQLDPVPSEVESTPPGATLNRPWSERITATFKKHRLYVVQNFPQGSFSTITATIGEILTIEDELVRHLMPLRYGDLPDGSIGDCWGHFVRKSGLAGPIGKAPLTMPHLSIGVVDVHVYGHELLVPFLSWLNGTYFMEKLPKYFEQKKEWKDLRLTAASAANSASLLLTGRPAQLAQLHERKLTDAGGFVPAKQLPPPK